jgi:hypothetical protein
MEMISFDSFRIFRQQNERYMKSTLPFFAFVSLNITPYVTQPIMNYNPSEYLPGGNKAQRESMVNDEESITETVKYKEKQA